MNTIVEIEGKKSRRLNMGIKQKITTFVFVMAVLLGTAFPVYAGQGNAPVAGCQPGAGNEINGEWQLLSVEEFAQFLVDEFNYPSYELALERATSAYDFCDHNGDNYACATIQTFPNDASGSSKWWLVEDNHPYGGE